MENENVHISVLLEEVTDFLTKRDGVKNPTIFDGTLGGGGHTKEFIKNGATVYASDLDNTAIDTVRQSMGDDSNKKLFTSNSSFLEYLETFDNESFDGILLDLGFSSNQLEFSNRGFSYQKQDEVLDLRYDMERGEPVWKMISRMKDEKELGNILYRFGGEYLSGRIGRALHNFIIKQQGQAPTVGQVVETVTNAIPKKFRNKTNATLSRVWQALRIWVNDELNILTDFLPVAQQKLKKNGRLAIICFHSLEDKIVTKFMRKVSKTYELDEMGNRGQDYKILTPRPVKPSEDEVERNRRSRSATLRILEKLV